MASILVLSDFAEELNTVREQLSDPHGQVTYCHSVEKAEDLLLSEQPLLVVLAHSDIATAVKCHAALRDSIPAGQKQNYLTLLLCRSRDAEEAHTCCVSGMCDDYVVNRPLHDPRRIDLSVRQLVARGMSSRDSHNLSRQLSTVGSDIRNMNKTVRPALQQINQSHAALSHGVRKLPERLAQVVEQFREQLAGATGEQSPDQLRERLQQLLQSSVDPEIQSALQQLASSSELLAELEANFRTLADPLAAQSFPPAQPEVLIVDDDEVYRSILVRVVEKAGMRAVECEDGPAAVRQLRLRLPGIVLLDHEMPGMTGLDVLQHMREMPHTAAVPVVMLTGVGTKEVVNDSIARGIQGFLVKPSNAAAILEKIRQVLEKAAAAAK